MNKVLITIQKDKKGHLLNYNLCHNCGIIISPHLHLCPMCHARVIGGKERQQ